MPRPADVLEAKRLCTCGQEMRYVRALTEYKRRKRGEKLKPIRLVCRCGRMVKA